MTKIRTGDIRPGMVLERDGTHWTVVEVILPEAPAVVVEMRCRVGGENEVWWAGVDSHQRLATTPAEGWMAAGLLVGGLFVASGTVEILTAILL